MLGALQAQGPPSHLPQASLPGLLVQPAALAWEHPRFKPLPVRPHCSLLTLLPDFTSSQSPVGQEVGAPPLIHLPSWGSSEAQARPASRTEALLGTGKGWGSGYPRGSPGWAEEQASESPGFESWVAPLAVVLGPSKPHLFQLSNGAIPSSVKSPQLHVEHLAHSWACSKSSVSGVHALPLWPDSFTCELT